MCRDFENGRHACLVPMLFQKTRLVVVNDPAYKHVLYDDGW